MSLRCVLLLTAALLPGVDLAASQASVPENSSARVRAFAATPDWTGLWETETAALLASSDGIKQLLGAVQGSPPKPTAASAGQQQSATGDTPLPFELALIYRVQLLRKPPYQPQWERKYESALKASAARPLPLACSVSFPLREGRTLVIDTIEHKLGPVFPEWPRPTADLSEQAHFIERLQRLDRDTLQDDMTIEDPQRLAHPWHVTIRYARVQNLDRMIGGEVCAHNRNQLVNGKMIITPP